MQISHTNILRKSLNNAVLAALTSKKMMLEKLTISLDALLPEHILKLGYAYITKDGKIVISGKELEIGNSIEINFVDAVIDAKVEGKEVKEWKLEKVSRKN
jgi:exodeoxyribonuclease VII large subunit